MTYETNRIYTGDCLDILPHFAGMAKLIMTSPPYPGQKNDTRTVGEWLEWFGVVAVRMYDALQPNGVAVVNVMFKRTDEGWFDMRLFTEVPYIMDVAGFNCIDVYPFLKMNPAPNGANGEKTRTDIPAWEPVFVFTKAEQADDYFFAPVRKPYKPKSMAKNGTVYSTRGDAIRPHPAGARQPNYLMVSTSGSSRTRIPRAQGQSYPVEVPERFILQHTEPGDLVIDPFAGVGTTCKVARDNGRDYVGIEILADEAEKARRWLARPYQKKIVELAYF